MKNSDSSSGCGCLLIVGLIVVIYNTIKPFLVIIIPLIVIIAILLFLRNKSKKEKAQREYEIALAAENEERLKQEQLELARQKEYEIQKELEAKEFQSKMDSLLSLQNKFTPQEILKLYSSPHIEDFTGIYIIINEDNGKAYVGQSKKVISRIANQHLLGIGNPDVYADYRYGANQTIQTLSLAHSGYASLDKLERDYILRFDAFTNGYNKTIGNKN